MAGSALNEGNQWVDNYWVAGGSCKRKSVSWLAWLDWLWIWFTGPQYLVAFKAAKVQDSYRHINLWNRSLGHSFILFPSGGFIDASSLIVNIY